MDIIARIETDFPEKFGIPRQASLIPGLRARIVFEPEYRDPNALKGIEDFTHLWLIWKFSESVKPGKHTNGASDGQQKNERKWSPTVLPPRLGGKTRMGVFATRSPFRPNPIGLSSVRLIGVEDDPKVGKVLIVSGADLLDGTPIYDIKPYLKYADSHEDAISGFADQPSAFDHELTVEFPQELLEILPEDKREPAIGILAQDPRPAYQKDPERRYGTAFAGFDIRYHVKDDVLTVCEVVPYVPMKKKEK